MRRIATGLAAAALVMTSAPTLAKSSGTLPPSKAKTWCERAGVAAMSVGTAVAGASTLVGTAGVAAVAHSSGAAILTSVGVGGTGYLAGTLGGVGATTLGVASAPAVIAGAATVGVAGVGAYAWCRYRK